MLIKRLFGQLRPFHRDFYKYLWVVLFYEALQVVSSYTISGVIQLYNHQASFQTWVLFFTILLLGNELLTRFDNYVDTHISVMLYSVQRYLKGRALNKFFEMDLRWHQDRNSGALVGKINSGVDKTQTFLNDLAWEFLPTLIQATLTLIPLFYYSPGTIPIIAAALLLFSHISLAANKYRLPLRRERHDLYEKEWESSVQYVQSIETVKLFGQERRLASSYGAMQDLIFSLGRKESYRAVNYFNRWRQRIIFVVRFAFLLLWLWQLQQGLISLASLVFLFTLGERLLNSFWRFARMMDQAAESSESIERLLNLLDEKADMADGSYDPGKLEKVRIDFNSVHFSYRDDAVLHDLRIVVEPGTTTALVGPSGSGKTTIRKLATRNYDASGGSIFFNGVDVREWRLESLRSCVAYVPQGDEVYIYNASLSYNIAFSNAEATQAEVERAADLAGIHNDITNPTKFPDGYETEVGERGVRLSGGQKQRIALARAILADRPVVILDEATNALDAITEFEIQTKLQEAFHGKTMIIIAHRLSTVWDIADRIVVVKDGRKIEEGSHQELMAGGGLYAEMVGHQLTTVSS